MPSRKDAQIRFSLANGKVVVARIVEVIGAQGPGEALEPQLSPALVLTLPALCLHAVPKRCLLCAQIPKLYTVLVSKGCLCEYTHYLVGE